MNSDELGIGGLRSSHRPRQRRSRGCFVTLLALAVLLGAGIFVYVKGVDLLSDSLAGPADYTGNGSGSVVVQVRDGDTTTDIGDALKRKKVVASSEAFTDVARENPRSREIQAGFYTLKRRMSAKSALTLLLDPASRMQNTVTVPEGLTVDQTVELLAKKTDVPVQQFARALRQPQRIGLPTWAHGNAEGFLYPATYNVPPKAGAAKILGLLVDRFKHEAAGMDFRDRAAKLGLTPEQALTSASIAQAEMSKDRFRPMVTRTLYNRVEAGQAFQLDTTGEYGYGGRLAKSTIVPPSISARADLYDTYRHAGWPPGPINSPGDASLQAALQPADGPWMFFVTTNLETGETHFSTTFAQHSKWVKIYRRYCDTSKYC